MVTLVWIMWECGSITRSIRKAEPYGFNDSMLIYSELLEQYSIPRVMCTNHFHVICLKKRQLTVTDIFANQRYSFDLPRY